MQLPRFIPPERVPGFPLLALRAMRNTLSCIPESVYREPMVVIRGLPTLAFVTDPVLVRQVLVEAAGIYRKPALGRKLLGPLVGESLLLAEGDDWQRQHEAIAPLLASCNFSRLYPLAADAVDRIATDWRASSRSEPHGIDRQLTAMMLDIVTRFVLGAHGEALARLIAGDAEAYFRAMPWRLLCVALGIPTGWPRRGGGTMSAIEARLRSATARAVGEERNAADAGSSLAAKLISAAALSEPCIVDNALTLVLAGYETTARALTWALFLVSRFPAWELRLLEEIQRIAPAGPIGPEALAGLELTGRVFRETLRLYPPIPELTRMAVRDTELGGHRLRRGTLVNVPIYAVHRHRALWRDPDAFDPDRFHPDRAHDIERGAFIPFSIGRQSCIGSAMAMTLGPVLLASLLRTAHFSCPPDRQPQLINRLTLQVRGGLSMRVRLRAQDAP